MIQTLEKHVAFLSLGQVAANVPRAMCQCLRHSKRFELKKRKQIVKRLGEISLICFSMNLVIQDEQEKCR